MQSAAWSEQPQQQQQESRGEISKKPLERSHVRRHRVLSVLPRDGSHLLCAHTPFPLHSPCGCVKVRCAGGGTGSLSAGWTWPSLSSSPPSPTGGRTAFSLSTTRSTMRKRSVGFGSILSLWSVHGCSLILFCCFVAVPSCVYTRSHSAGAGAHGLPLCLCCLHHAEDPTEVAPGSGSTNPNGHEGLGNGF